MKDFISLKKDELKDTINKTNINSLDLYENAVAKAERGSYGLGISTMIQSMEESMKELILIFDDNGFQFRKKVKGINQLFKDLPLDLKGDYTFGKGQFLSARVYGFLKFALYKCPNFYVEVHMNKEDDRIEDIQIVEVYDLIVLYPILNLGEI